MKKIGYIHTGSHEFQLSDDLKAIGLTADDIWLKPILSMNAIIEAINSRYGCQSWST